MLRASNSASSSRTVSPNPSLKRAGHKGPRTVVTNDQKRELRRWWNDPIYGKRKHEDAVVWFNEQYGFELKRSTLSDVLGKKGSWLDTVELTPFQLSSVKNRGGKWPVLESALLEWQILYDQHPDAGVTSGDLLRLKATELWQRLPEYKDLPLPFEEGKTWSDGWLTGFKKRSGLKERRRHGEAESAEITAETEETMQQIREAAVEYGPENTYNCDETGYYWKAKPDRSLSTIEHSGTKKEKDRMSVLLTTNASGSDKLPLWFIGKSKRPNCFRHEGIQDLDRLGAKYRSNAKAWMNHEIMKDYLLWLDARMRAQHKSILLLMDNFGAHTLAVDLLSTSQCLTHVHIKWLPPNATSHYQPLDQGIIANWKVHVKSKFVRFMAEIFDQNKNLSQEMHILRSIRWGIEAWEHEVTTATISNCWTRSQCINYGAFPAIPVDIWAESQPQLDNLRGVIQRLRDQGVIAAIPTSIKEYISPYEERVFDAPDLDTLVDDVVAQFTIIEADEDTDSDNEVEEQPPISNQAALEALTILMRYEERRDDGDIDFLKQLRKEYRLIRHRTQLDRKQGTLDSFLGVK